MIPFTIINKKEQVINLRRKYFNLYHIFYYNKQKEQAKNIITLCMPKLKIINIKFFLLFSFAVYKNNRKDNKF